MTADPGQCSLRTQRVFTGRALHVQPGGTWYVSRHYDVYRSDDNGQTWTKAAGIPPSPGQRLLQMSRLACRALRHEVKAFLVLSDGTSVASCRRGVHYAPPGETFMRPSRIETGSPAAAPPMCLSRGPGDRVVWGEYFGNQPRRPVRLFVSDDGARSFQLAYTFEAGDIRHVHNVYYDAGVNEYWVLVGDHHAEPGIGRLSADFKHLAWVGRGQQIYRAVCLFDFGDHFVYGTDTEMEPNAILRLDKNTGRVQPIARTNGSCIYACRFGPLHVLATSVEPSPVNRSGHAELWLSRNGDEWQPVFRAPKDRWNATHFQFGSLVLPRGESNRDVILFSGQAVQGLDNQALVGRLREEPSD